MWGRRLRVAIWALLYGLLRLLFWTFGVGVALFPTLWATEYLPSWHVSGAVAAINATGHFRDLFFVLVPASVVPLTTALDSLCLHPSKSDIIRLIIILALVVNIVILGSGLVGFVLTPAERGPLNSEAFSLYSQLIGWGLAISLGTEIFVSGSAALRAQRSGKSV